MKQVRWKLKEKNKIKSKTDGDNIFLICDEFLCMAKEWQACISSEKNVEIISYRSSRYL